MKFLALCRDSYDGKSRSLGLFSKPHAAENVIRRDVAVYLKELGDADAFVNDIEPDLCEIVGDGGRVMCTWEMVAT